jgi:multidrug efflux system outer membrane protein
VRTVIVLLCLLALSGCVAPKAAIPPQAAVNAPAGWRGGVRSPGEVDPDWWQSFGDPVLTNVVKTALENNDDISVAASRVSEARALFHLARAQALPNVNGVAEGSRDRDVNPGFGVPESQTSGAGEVEVSYDLDLFGRLSSETGAARAALLSSEAARDNVRLAVAASAAGGYITLRALDERVAVLRDTLAERGAELTIARRRAGAGYSSQLDLTQAEAEYRATEQLIPATELAITRQENGLSLLLGDNPSAIRRGISLAALANPAVPVLMPSALLRRRPDIVAAEEALAAADHKLDSARAAFMPDVRLAASGGLVGSTIVTGSPITVFALGGSVLAPLFDSGRLAAQRDAATARRDQAAYTYRKVVLAAFREVEDELAAVQRDNEQQQTLAAERDVLTRSLSLATHRFRAGYSPYLDQLDAQRNLLATQLALVQVRSDLLGAVVLLYQALGGGWAMDSLNDDQMANVQPSQK